jgi:hypothetical protein
VSSEIISDADIEKLLDKTYNDIMDIIYSSNAWYSKQSMKTIAKAIVDEFLRYVKPKLVEYMKTEFIQRLIKILKDKGIDNAVYDRKFWYDVSDDITSFYDAFADSLYEDWLGDVSDIAGEQLKEGISSILKEILSEFNIKIH